MPRSRTALDRGCQKCELSGVPLLGTGMAIWRTDHGVMVLLTALQNRGRLFIAYIRRSYNITGSRLHALIVSPFWRRKPISVTWRANVDPKPGTLEAGFGRHVGMSDAKTGSRRRPRRHTVAAPSIAYLWADKGIPAWARIGRSIGHAKILSWPQTSNKLPQESHHLASCLFLRMIHIFTMC